MSAVQLNVTSDTALLASLWSIFLTCHKLQDKVLDATDPVLVAQIRSGLVTWLTNATRPKLMVSVTCMAPAAYRHALNEGLLLTPLTDAEVAMLQQLGCSMHEILSVQSGIQQAVMPIHKTS